MGKINVRKNTSYTYWVMDLHSAEAGSPGPTLRVERSKWLDEEGSVELRFNLGSTTLLGFKVAFNVLEELQELIGRARYFESEYEEAKSGGV